MNELDRQIRELTEKTEYTRFQFLKAELGTCLTALDMAKYELSVGNIAIAKREIDSVEKGIRTIERFLSETSGEQKTQLESQLADLKAAKAELHSMAPELNG